MIGCYNYTVILTYIGTVCGFIGISYMAGGDQKMALIFLMAAGFCDMFDGKIASTMKRTRAEKRFGIQIDSLSDLVCFGVLPAFIGYSCTELKILRVAIPAVYLLCALIRLAWFNVDEEERQSEQEGERHTYLGLPVTTSALLVPMVFSAAKLLRLPLQYVAPAALLVIAVAFITPFRLKKPGWVGKIVMIVAGLGGFALVLLGMRV